MTLFNFRSTTYFKAFILYAFVSAIVTHLAIEFRSNLDRKNSLLFHLINPLTKEKGINHVHKLIFSVIITFIISIFVYISMHFIFGWGGGMLVKTNKK